MFGIIDYFSKVFTSSAHLDERRPMYLYMPESSEIKVTLCEGITPLQQLEKEILLNIIEQLSQRDKISLGQTSSFFREFIFESLTKRIVIREEASSSGNGWEEFTGVHGDEHLLTHNIRILVDILESRKKSSCKEIIIETGYESDEFIGAIVGLIIVCMPSVEYIQISNSKVRNKINEILFIKGSPKLNNITLDRLTQLNGVTIEMFPQMKSLTLLISHDNLLEYNETSFNIKVITQLLLRIEELIIADDEDASLRIIKFFTDLVANPMIFENVKSLKFNHFHGIHNYNSVLRNFSISLLEAFNLPKIETLEIEFNCDENCDCLPEFMISLAPQLTNLKHVSLIEKHFFNKETFKHEVFEAWDINAFRLLENLPKKQKLKRLMIKNSNPVDGHIEDGLEGNYLRRRSLYVKILPKFENLEVLVLPSLVSTICCYEQVVSDLLWNGCSCEQCNKFLPIFDDYLMTHQYFDNKAFDFKDMISPRLFGFFGDSLEKRIENRVVPVSDSNGTACEFDILTKCLKVPIKQVSWNFHGYMKVICRDFKNDNDDNFYNEEEFLNMIPDDVGDHCDYNEQCFDPLVKCVDHFFQNNYLNNWLAHHMEHLQWVILGGLYYRRDREKGYFHVC